MSTFNGGDAIHVRGRFARVIGHSYWSNVRGCEVVPFKHVVNGHYTGPLRVARAKDVKRVEEAPCSVQ